MCNRTVKKICFLPLTKTSSLLINHISNFDKLRTWDSTFEDFVSHLHIPTQFLPPIAMTAPPLYSKIDYSEKNVFEMLLLSCRSVSCYSFSRCWRLNQLTMFNNEQSLDYRTKLKITKTWLSTESDTRFLYWESLHKRCLRNEEDFSSF